MAQQRKRAATYFLCHRSLDCSGRPVPFFFGQTRESAPTFLHFYFFHGWPPIVARLCVICLISVICGERSERCKIRETKKASEKFQCPLRVCCVFLAFSLRVLPHSACFCSENALFLRVFACFLRVFRFLYI